MEEYFILKFINSLFANLLGNKTIRDKKQREFEEIINSINNEFTPEPISDEKELQGQLTIFLKTRFPQKNIQREVSIGRGNRVDVVVQQRFAFELKVPRNRIDLRNLESQLSEYAETYQNICSIVLILDQSLLSIAQEYAGKYQANCNARTIILGGGVKRNQKRRKSSTSSRHQKRYSTGMRRDTKSNKIVQGIQEVMKIIESFSQIDANPTKQKNQSKYGKKQERTNDDPFGVNKFADSFKKI
jgi:hypothetical protein